MSSINLYAPSFDPFDSYGRVARELSKGLRQQGWNVGEIGELADSPKVLPILGGILLGYPTNYHSYGILAQKSPKIALTMFESTILPTGWVQALNSCDAVIVPSNFCASVMRAQGVTPPIHVVPLGISDTFRAARLRGNDTPLVFLCIGDRGRRKNALATASAFVKAFGDNDKYKLIVKVRESSSFAKISVANPNISIMAQDMSDDELLALYYSCHVMIFASRGEGFGLPPREFSATGGVSLATNFSGLSDNIQRYGVPLDCELELAWAGNDEWYGKLGFWADPTIQTIADRLTVIANNYNELRYDAFTRFALFSQETYQWSVFASKVAAIYTEVLNASYGDRKNSSSPTIGG